MKCDRCFVETQGSIMSKFNTQEICFSCKDKEQADPGYAAASKAELEAVQAGAKNYPGVGLSDALRETFIKKFMESKEEFFGNVNWNRFEGGYDLEEADSNECHLCKEPIVEMCVNFHDVDEVYNACLKCGAAALKGMMVGVQQYMTGIQEDINRIEELQAEGK